MAYRVSKKLQSTITPENNSVQRQRAPRLDRSKLSRSARAMTISTVIDLSETRASLPVLESHQGQSDSLVGLSPGSPSTPHVGSKRESPPTPLIGLSPRSPRSSSEELVALPPSSPRIFADPQSQAPSVHRDPATLSPSSPRISADPQSQAASALPAQAAGAGQGAAALAGCQRLSHALKSSLLGAVSCGLGFGSKPWVEAIATASALAAGADADTATMVAGIAGGLWIGAVHQAAGNLANALLSAPLGLYTHAPDVNSEAANQLLELITISLPVYGGFCATYAARGAFMEPLANIGFNIPAIAASKTAATMLGGVIQGFVTDILRQAGAEVGVMKSTAPTKKEMDKATSVRVREGLAKMKADMTFRKLCHDFVGKLVGGVVGNLAAAKIIPADFGAINPADGLKWGGSGMAAFLTGWFGGIHGGALFGKIFDLCVAEPIVKPPNYIPVPPPQDAQKRRQ